MLDTPQQPEVFDRHRNRAVALAAPTRDGRIEAHARTLAKLEATEAKLAEAETEIKHAYRESLGECVSGSWFMCARCRAMKPASQGAGDDWPGLCDTCWCAVERTVSAPNNRIAGVNETALTGRPAMVAAFVGQVLSASSPLTVDGYVQALAAALPLAFPEKIAAPSKPLPIARLWDALEIHDAHGSWGITELCAALRDMADENKEARLKLFFVAEHDAALADLAEARETICELRSEGPSASTLTARERSEVERLREVVTTHEKDIAAAAGELRVYLPAPGSDMAKMLRANSLLRAEVSELRLNTQALAEEHKHAAVFVTWATATECLPWRRAAYDTEAAGIYDGEGDAVGILTDDEPGLCAFVNAAAGRAKEEG